MTTFAHGVCDYLIGLTLLVGIPFAGLAAGDRVDMLVPEAIGFAILLKVTCDELGALSPLRNDRCPHRAGKRRHRSCARACR